MIEGRSEHHPEAIYYLRFLRDGKRVWQAVGTDADTALSALRNVEHDLQSMSLGRPVPEGATPPPPLAPQTEEVSLDDAITSYLGEVRRFRSPKTIAACKHMLTLFGSRFPGKSIKEITRNHLLDHTSFLQEGGLSERTICNHAMRIGILLKTHGIVGLLSATDKPKYDEKEVEAYTSDQLQSLFVAANRDERIRLLPASWRYAQCRSSLEKTDCFTSR